MTPNKTKPTKPVSPRPVGRPPKQETLDYLREKGERETLKLCADLRSKIAAVAQRIMAKVEDPVTNMRDLTTSLDTLNRSGKTAAEMSAILRKAKVGEGDGTGGGASAEDIIRVLEKEMK